MQSTLPVGNQTTDHETESPCDCAQLPDGVPCADCYISGTEEWSA